ncbi:MAG: metallophosphoesterase [Oscillospiraceae bacterium]|nr:metallophosphoesterase [Oscillospiraceae bacterium]
MVWVFVFGSALIGVLVGLFYLISRTRRLWPFSKLKEKHKLLSWVAATVPLAALALFWYLLYNLFTMFVVILHLMFIAILFELIGFLVHKITKKPRIYWLESAAAILATTVVLCIGWHLAHAVRVTEYRFKTEKQLGGEPLRVVMFADSHLGITLDKTNFPKEMERVQAANPDLVIIAGDYVDDDTEKDDMLAACAELGKLQTKYGVFFTYGNHDNGYFHYRNFSSQELRDALTANNVTILEDEAMLIDDRFYLVGRLDRTFEDRVSAQKLTEGLDTSKYIIMIDHQPNDYQNEAESGADLVLSGHTHGGHIFPAGQIGLLLGMNDRVYGTERRGLTNFIVTSGISGWAIPFKTGTWSEFCIIDIEGPDYKYFAF